MRGRGAAVTMSGLRIRQARRTDLAALWPLAQQLDSYNVPADRAYLRRLLATSEQSFAGRMAKSRARYLFVMERLPEGGVVGCSLILAKHGTPGFPHLWLDVTRRRMTSRTLGRRVTHEVLQLGSTTDGPTEIGGLIVAPRYRRRPEHLGRQLSYVRLVYMAMHPERVESRVLVEYLPPLTSTGNSVLWEHFGRPFTRLSYRTADRLSITNKEFILGLFPREPIYTDFLPAAVRAQLGVVHPAAVGACALLRRVGFRYLRQIEPFDGGPYFGAPRARISLIQATRRGRLVSADPGRGRWPQVGLVCAEPSRGEFRAVWSPFRWRLAHLEVPPSTIQWLEVREGGPAYATPVAR